MKLITWFAWVAVPIVAPILVYVAYSIWHDKVGWVAGTVRLLKWMALSLVLSLAGFAILFVGAVAYLSRDTCDDTVPSPVVRNNRGDTAEGQVQVCTWIGTVVNSYITLELHQPTRIWPKKDLIGYEEAGPGRDPILRWVDDDTLSVDLGKVYWVSSRLNKVGSVRIIYAYSVVDRPR